MIYGPILPDQKLKDELNAKLNENYFFSTCSGMIMPDKKTLKKLTFTPEKLTVENGDFSKSMASSDIIKIENSTSEPKALKLKLLKESSLGLTEDIRVVFQDILYKNLFILLQMNWSSDMKLLSKASDIYLLQCLPKEYIEEQIELVKKSSPTVLDMNNYKSQPEEYQIHRSDSDAYTNLESKDEDSKFRSMEEEIEHLKKENRRWMITGRKLERNRPFRS